jgi:hypothetical protein
MAQLLGRAVLQIGIEIGGDRFGAAEIIGAIELAGFDLGHHEISFARALASDCLL